MGIYIKMHKVFELNQVGYYEVLTDNFGGSHFFVGFDKQNRAIQCYLTKDFSIPFRIIKFDNENELLGDLPGVDTNILGRIVIKGLRLFAMDDFPES